MGLLAASLDQKGRFGTHLIADMSYLNNRFVSTQFSLW